MQRCLHGDPDMLKVHVHVHVHETRFTAQNICLSHSSTKDPGKVSMHAQASALRMHGCALAMGVYFTENTGFDSCTCTEWCGEIGSPTSLDACNSGASSDVREPISLHQAVHELYSAEYRCMVKVCAPCVGQCRVYMYITKMTRTWANFTSLVCTASLLSVVCYAVQERQKAFRSGSPQNALPNRKRFLLDCEGIRAFPNSKIKSNSPFSLYCKVDSTERHTH